nr:MAG TPA: WWamide peptide [Bacteriophage sp.]DAZ75734.1 MAG TPA: WWamide peptide [Caudoviricetes sp.]
MPRFLRWSTMWEEMSYWRQNQLRRTKVSK